VIVPRRDILSKKYISKGHYVWSSQDERFFILGLKRTRKKNLLEKYRDGLNQRTEWGAIDPVIIFQFLEDEINKLEAEINKQKGVPGKR
jgi:hypothetical protein